MLTVTGIVVASLSINLAVTDRPVLPRAVIEAGLSKAKCSVRSDKATIVGTEWLSNELQIVEVACWRANANIGSVLFAVPVGRPRDAQVLMLEDLKGDRIESVYSVASPGFDPKTRTLSSFHMRRDAGDCGTIAEWKWTGWYFQLLYVWNKTQCDGEPFEWDNRFTWQVYPKHP
jgi:hypothetical protein